ncbi:MAG: metallophosphoesterase [Bacteroidales bacterium]|nr:metallophosphoesterase [Bacteroidales bacterium]
MKYAFFLIVLVLFFGMLAYVLTRGWQTFPGNIRMLYAQIFGGLLSLLMIGLFFENVLPQGLAKIISFAGYTFLITVVYLFLSFLVVDIIRLANYFLHFAPAGMHGFRLYVLSGSLGLIVVALFIGHYRFNHPEIVKLNLTVDRPLKNKEVKIVAASDIHLGNSIDIQMLRKYVKLINAQHPDIVLLVGDITDRSASPLAEQNMKTELQSIHAPLGVFAIRGNHEYYSGKPQQIAGYLKASGITVLIDSVCLVDNSFYIIGRDDRTNTKRKSLNDITQGLDQTIPKILLDHQPYQLEATEQNGIDLQLSGHTHNGQFFPGNLLVKRMFELAHGYLKKGKTHYYVSSGLGIWGPQYRIGTQSELVDIRLKY